MLLLVELINTKMFGPSSPYKARNLCRLAVACALMIAIARPEERSIMDGCAVSTFQNDGSTGPKETATCDRGFKTYYSGIQSNNQEITHTLAKPATIVSVFVQQENADRKKRFGTMYIWIGDNPTPFSTALLTRSTTPLYDTGFRKLTQPTFGKQIVLRRNGYASDIYGSTSINVQEVRAYQTQNLIYVLQGTVTISATASPINAAQSPQNLITNLDFRTSGDTNVAPIINASGTLASYKSCYRTSRTQMSAQNHLMVLTVDLKSSFFQHAVLFVGDIGTNWFLPSGPIYLENVRVFVGDSPLYTQNKECSGGPFLVWGNPNSFVYAWNTSGFAGNYWKYGEEVWCNLQGRYTTLVVDMNHKAATLYQISLCALAVMGAVYDRPTPAPSTFFLVAGFARVLSIEKIVANPTYPIGNTLNVMLRQKAGSELTWVTFTQDTLDTKVNLAPDISLAPGDFTVILESYDLDGGVFSALKTDSVILKVLPNACGQALTHNFNNLAQILLVREYQPTIYFPTVLFQGPHTYTGYVCGGLYTQSITIDAPVTGVTLTDLPTGPDLRPNIAISSSAPAGTSFTLTFTGHYVHAPTSTDITASFTQTYQIRAVFSTDYLDQPTISPSLTSAQLTFPVPPAPTGATPPTQYLYGSSFTVTYPFKAGTADSLGNTPPTITPLPYSGFSSSEISKGQPSLGTTFLDSPLGVLTAVGFVGELDPSSTLFFQCDPWTPANKGSNVPKTLNFANSVVSAFQGSFSVTCAYELSLPPTFAQALTVETLTSGAARSWLLPTVTAGSLASAKIRFEPAPEVAAFLMFEADTRTVYYDGTLFGDALVTSSVQFVLIDAAGQESPQMQILKLRQPPAPSCSLSAQDLKELSESLKADPIRLEVQAAQLDFKTVSYKAKYDRIDQLAKASNCGNPTIKLVSKHPLIEIEPSGFQLTQLSNESMVEATFEDSFLLVTVDWASLQIPIRAQFKTCAVTSLAFEKDELSVNFKIGSDTLREALPNVVQSPSCGVVEPEIEIKSFALGQTKIPANSVVTLDKNKQELLVYTKDVSLGNQRATVVISGKGGSLTVVRPLVVTIFFEAPAAVAATADHPDANEITLDFAKNLGVELGIASIVVPLITKEQAAIVKASDYSLLSEEHLFMSVPLAARLTQGVEQVKKFADEQLAFISSKPETASIDSSPPEARFERITNLGLLKIKFTRSLIFPNGTLEELQLEISEHKNKTQFDKLSSRARVQLYVVRGNEFEAGLGAEEFILSRWDLLALDKDSMQIQCVFSDPLQVSQQEEPDLLLIQLELGQYKDSRGKGLPESLVKYLPVPVQMPSSSTSDDAFYVDKIGSVVAGVAIGILTGAGLLFILLRVFLQYIWSIINSLQIIQKQNLFAVKVPANVESFVNFFKSLSSISFEIEFLKVENHFYLPEQAALSFSFQNAGYWTSYALINLQQPLLMLCAYFALVLVWSLLAIVSRCCVKSRYCIDRVGNLLFWNPFLRLVIEGSADFTFFALLNIRTLQWDDLHLGVNLSNYVSIGVLSLTAFVILAFSGYSLCRRNSWATQSFKARAGTYYDGMHRERKDKQWAVFMVPLVFFGRRFALSATLVFWDQCFVAQIATQLVTSTLVLCVVNWATPLDSPLATWKESFNEEVSLAITYLLMYYSASQSDLDLRYRLGFAHIGVFCLIVLVHVCVISRAASHLLMLHCRRCKSRGWCYCLKRKRSPTNKKLTQKAVHSQLKPQPVIQEVSDAALSQQSQEALQGIGLFAQRRVAPDDSEFERSHMMINSSALILLNKPIIGMQNKRRPRITLAEEINNEEDDLGARAVEGKSQFSRQQEDGQRIESNFTQNVETSTTAPAHAQIRAQSREFEAEGTSSAGDFTTWAEKEIHRMRIEDGAREYDRQLARYIEEMRAQIPDN